MKSFSLQPIVRATALGLTLAAGAFAMTGCSSNNPSSVWVNPSPELFTRGDSFSQNHANFVLTVDRDARSMADDFQRAFMYDRASRMNKSPNPW